MKKIRYVLILIAVVTLSACGSGEPYDEAEAYTDEY